MFSHMLIIEQSTNVIWQSFSIGKYMYSRQPSWHDNKNQDTSSQLRYGYGSEHQILAYFTATKLGIV